MSRCSSSSPRAISCSSCASSAVSLSPRSVARALDVLCELRETRRGDCLIGVLEQALKEQIDMLRIMAQGSRQSPSDDFRKGRRE